ncbi:hypothetical protein GCM10027403_09110 [Arthrobacter tecti]
MSDTLHDRKAKAAKRTAQKAAKTQEDEQVQILAARLRVTTDSKLNKPTPEWVRELAEKPL